MPKTMAAMAPPKSLNVLNLQIQESEPPPSFSRRAVLGEGPIGAAMALVGEQPGDQEDLAGRPFVGASGRLLDRALAEAGIARGEAYVTNAVKNFKYRREGKRRIHQKPTTGEIRHYRWWLERELEFVHPLLVVTLGSTATEALAGKAIPVMKNRGPTDRFALWRGFITVHPSSLLRQPDGAARAEAFVAFVRDLEWAHALAANTGAVAPE
ncbi:MAG TPA: UdgX family uracil-DNA binding protein [Caulobacteraceae bacterium]|jgi:DNA polymerase|nr:UdgX family uracil-DNA binding protein [Caulobacteraceae bacterium]